ncbi:MAG: ATP-dependent metallopeptidase FtsH/Yme1/Tma family protein, partial [Paramuribaculum sp.]|nr:ATP-dependent metallopeptidase FtsH/Yme1/Tma family protein [Paramuribaculum sp.]
MQPNQKKPGFRLNMYWMYAIVIVFLVGILYLDDDSLNREVSYSKFETYVSSGGVKKIVVYPNKNQAQAFLNDSLAEKVFTDAVYKPGSGMKALITTSIPSADKLQDKIDQWQQEGVFNGEVKFEKSSDYT